MSDSISLSFPHGKLTKMIGKPSNTFLLQVFKQQLYKNVLDPIQLMMVSNNIPWTNPVHPDDVPMHAQGLTSVLCEQITPSV
jgi:hypothetical protein